MYQVDPDKIFKIPSEQDFNTLALEVFNFQYANNAIYKRFADGLGIKPDKVSDLLQIPFLPVEFFKSHEILSSQANYNSITFTSSSTTSQTPSKHIVTDVSVYESSFIKGFELFYGKPSDLTILALLPGYLEREGSSLIYMFKKLVELSGSKDSGFYLNNYTDLIKTIEKLKMQGEKVLLIGVTYALLDLAEMNISLGDDFIVMETGGMKGKRKEMVKEELHGLLKQKLNIKQVHSEYGMTELLSQAYSKQHGIFECPPWMKFLIRDMDDPFSYAKENKTGGINVIDLANIHSCSFIATQDLGRINGKTFEVMGRFDNSDVRGCNLMVS